MSRYFSHLIILPDESQLVDFIVELHRDEVSYYPFVGEVHSTVYVDRPILLSYRSDMEGKTLSLSHLTWALRYMDAAADATLYVYSLTPCTSCADDRFVATLL